MADLFYSLVADAPAASLDLSLMVESFELEEDERRPNELRLQLSDPHKVYGRVLQEGLGIELALGTTEASSLMFRGHIYRVAAEYPQEGTPALEVHAFDPSMKMGMKKRNRRFTDLTLSDIVSKVAQPYFTLISVDVKGDMAFSGNGIRQHEETDLAFLHRLADRYGCELYAESDEIGDTLQFKAQHIIMTSAPEVALYHGRVGVEKHVLGFTPSVDVREVQLARVFQGIDFETGQVLESRTAAVESPPQDAPDFFDEHWAGYLAEHPVQAANLQPMLAAAPTARDALIEELGSEVRECTPVFTTQDELNVRAENRYSNRIEGMRATASTHGDTTLRAQRTVAIYDVGERFSGNWYLTRVRHLFSPESGYRTELECQR